MMLDNLREIIELDKNIEEVQDMMLEGTDADMADFFIDEDGIAEIPDDELGKILNKIPEYDEEENLNKKLNKITEAYIPDSEILEEGEKIKKLKDINMKRKSRKDDDKYDSKNYTKKSLAKGALIGSSLTPVVMPSIIVFGLGAGVGALGGYASSKIGAKRAKKKAFKYTEGKPITKKLVKDLVNNCGSKKDIKKVEKWVRTLYGKFKTINNDNPEMLKSSEEWKHFLKTEILDKKIPEKAKQIESMSVSEDYCPDYSGMSYDEFYDEMAYECSLIEDYDNDEYMCEEYDYLNDEEYLTEVSQGTKKTLKGGLTASVVGGISHFAQVKSVTKQLLSAIKDTGVMDDVLSLAGEYVEIGTIQAGDIKAGLNLANKSLPVGAAGMGAVRLFPAGLIAGYLSNRFDRSQKVKELSNGIINESQIRYAIMNAATVRDVKKVRKWLKDIVHAYNKLKEKGYGNKEKHADLIKFIKIDAFVLLDKREQELKQMKKEKRLKESFDFDVEFFD